ncbi:type II toxin-antitoxin system ParD family antitoxin [Nodosilinea sp. PGN35]|uniref:type II toxin-antitoxin system ParD family antitoxin n=1 Tax=Nodosilinea sp. PGN35 TaxID=3020489 RepID=UPI0023B32421|nr:type II toxin-antitoxin system ParD family antitoxin [Nodosilinea sp. TSF1-S3]MDF0369141.1 type II toxin-antitoxin system ParD family antitoxin [Nodosilinea sp. TSF1-S3]
MEIALTPEVEQYIQAKVSSGQYASASEVFLAGIKLLQDIEQTHQGRYHALREEINISIEASDRGDVVNAETVFDHLQERLNQRLNQLQ